MKYTCNSFLINSIVFFSVMVINITSFAENMRLNDLAPNVPKINAEAYILIDYNSGQVLAEENADVRRDPASLTKIMTSYIIGQAVKSGKINPSDRITIDNDAWATGNPQFKGSSLMFLKPGDNVSVTDLIRGINLQSGNDACVAMANYVAGDQENFVRLMNHYAESLGLKNTYFKNVHGLDVQGQYSSARDMAFISQALIRDVPEEYAIYKEKEFTFDKIRQRNRNGLLWDKDLQVDGIKTGHTKAAGYNLVISATQGPMRLISVVLGANSSKEREIESKKLLTWGFRFFETVESLKASKAFVSESAWFGDSDHVQLRTKKDVYLTIPRGRISDLKISYVLNNIELRAPLVKNQEVGIVNFQLDGKIINHYPLIVMNEVKVGNIFSRVLDHIILLFNHLFS